MQEINSSRKTNNSDYGLKILILQTVAVAIVLLTAFGIRLFGGEIYSNLSRLYHEKFDDINNFEQMILQSIESLCICYSKENNFNYTIKDESYIARSRTLSVTKGRYYRVKCYHAITKNGVKESCTSVTDGIKIE